MLLHIALPKIAPKENTGFEATVLKLDTSHNFKKDLTQQAMRKQL